MSKPRQTEAKHVKCNTCRKLVKKIPTDRRNATKWIFIDTSGRQWYGNKCPNCRYGGMARVDTPSYIKPKKTYLDVLSDDMLDSVYC